MRKKNDTHPARTASLLLRTASSYCLTRLSRSLCAFRVSPGRLAPAPPPHADRSNPVPEDDFHLAYDVYGQFRFEDFDAEGVFRFGRQWVNVEQLRPHADFLDKEKEFDARVAAKRKPPA